MPGYAVVGASGTGCASTEIRSNKNRHSSDVWKINQVKTMAMRKGHRILSSAPRVLMVWPWGSIHAKEGFLGLLFHRCHKTNTKNGAYRCPPPINIGACEWNRILIKDPVFARFVSFLISVCHNSAFRGSFKTVCSCGGGRVGQTEWKTGFFEVLMNCWLKLRITHQVLVG